jgi:uncharacterized protein (TIGR02421 family)
MRSAAARGPRLHTTVAPGSRSPQVFERVADAARDHIHADRPLRRNLPGEGRIALDRALPFLAVYRRVPGLADTGTDELVTAVASYAHLPAGATHLEGVLELVRAVARAATEKLGAFVLVEVWAGAVPADAEAVEPGVRIHVPAGTNETAEALRAALGELRLGSEGDAELGVPAALASIEVLENAAVAPPGLAPLDPGGGALHVGIEVAPFFRDPASGQPFPRVIHALRGELARAFERAAFTFCQERTSLDPPHYRALGRAHAGRAASHVDRRLAEVYGAFDPLLQVTPVNTEEAWSEFKEGGFERTPVLRYRPLPFDPEYLKRRLFHVPIEKVEDPLLNYLFREKQEELDREITLVRSLETRRFRWASYQLHGVAEPELLALARQILDRLPLEEEEEYAEEGSSEPGYVDAEAFARAAETELDHYRRLSAGFTGGVEILPDVTAGLMVTKGVLCISRSLSVPRHRLEPLLHHEVGTHVVTYSNGLAQPFKIFASGLAGYEALQEGLAVLAEYVCGGLTRARARVIAGRVVAVNALVERADFVEAYRCLVGDYGFPRHTAFIMTVRVYRGGGLTKDAQYLRGLHHLLGYLRGEGTIEPLFVGKLGLAHITAVQELVLRGVLELPPVKPRWLTEPAAPERLLACRRMGVMDLVETIER